MGNANMPEPRSMTLAEIRAFRSAGFDPVFVDTSAEVNPLRFEAEMTEWIIKNVYGEYKLDDSLLYADLVKLADKTFQKTYCLKIKDDEEVKNL